MKEITRKILTIVIAILIAATLAALFLLSEIYVVPWIEPILSSIRGG